MICATTIPDGPDAGTVAVVVDGTPTTLEVGPVTSLLRALRTASVPVPGGCEEGECGSCSVLVDGDLVCSCLVPAALVDGAEVTTVAGRQRPDLLAALAAHGAVQCGFCTPGMVVAAEAALDAATAAGEPLTRATATEALTGNLCRCTGYRGILEAVVEVSVGRLRATR
ncbi:2Fe-2S iron-sulfur cluster binding domain-containing protein [Iamia sp. SCSIO 61187]|uniref:(2Fe-2S)-binding protein n=1 Tax=Iamia sp. SCSIO 61187 TaxID=2722752 RepID=UPI001C62A029|nr:2Fe-2S iron-sulfur cluster-binding protein [Iamia sp. SCSIO 61187]QYG91036.1 2Fe-2S iron-sulfur cluster binding domain-containing protein [Iamia sp. SCSIO 61187]